MPSNKQKGFFITLEGGEGAGKTTQTTRLVEQLRAEGHEVYQTREPGGTPAAEALRHLLLFGEVDFSWQAEVMAHMAARADHLAQAIRPALAEGQIVICDRFHDSTWAYQGYGIGEARPDVLAFILASRQLVGGEPDMTLWLDIPCDIARKRIAGRGGKTDRYEGQAVRFHQRVRDGFCQIAESAPQRVRRIDASEPLEAVQASILDAVRQKLSSRSEGGWFEGSRSV